jgi:hypothetical protein
MTTRTSSRAAASYTALCWAHSRSSPPVLVLGLCLVGAGLFILRLPDTITKLGQGVVSSIASYRYVP